MRRSTSLVLLAALVLVPLGHGCGSDAGSSDDDNFRTQKDTGVDIDTRPEEVGVDAAEEPACTSGDECRSGVCRDGVCAEPSCDDGVQNGLETDVDCGGAHCSGCEKGKNCVANGDCETGACGGADGRTCVACEDGDDRVTSTSCGFEDRGRVEQTCDGGEWTRTDCRGVWYENCQEILADDPQADTDVYAIDPDGRPEDPDEEDDTLQPFEVFCDMDTDGGGWIRLRPVDPNGDAIFASFRSPEDRRTCSNPVDAFAENVAAQFKGADFLTGGPDQSTDDNPLLFANPSNGQRYSAGQMNLLRKKISEMSAASRQVAYVCDDDGLDPAHEFYAFDRSGDRRNLTPGTTANEEAHLYRYHTTGAETSADGPSSAPDPLETEQILPSGIRYGHFASSDAAGGVVWGYSRGYVLVRLAN